MSSISVSVRRNCGTLAVRRDDHSLGDAGRAGGQRAGRSLDPTTHMRQPPYGSSLSSWQRVGMKTPCRAAAWTSSSPSGALAGLPSSVKGTEARTGALIVQPPQARPGQRTDPARSGMRFSRGRARPVRAHRSTSGPSRRATLRAGRRDMTARPCSSSSRTWWRPRLPIRHGVHFWQDSSAKKRIVSARRRRRRVRGREDLDARRADRAPHSRKRVACERHVERGRREDPERRAAGHDRADAPGRAAGVIVDQLRSDEPFGAS